MGFSDDYFRRDAPFNEKTVHRVARITRVFVADVEVDLPEDFTDEDLKDIAKEYTTPTDEFWALDKEYVQCV